MPRGFFVPESKLVTLANKIRAKRLKTAPMSFDDMLREVDLIGMDIPYLPIGAELLKDETLVYNLKNDTTFDSKTVSTSAQSIKDAGAAGSWFEVAEESNQYGYLLRFYSEIDFKYMTVPTTVKDRTVYVYTCFCERAFGDELGIAMSNSVMMTMSGHSGVTIGDGSGASNITYGVAVKFPTMSFGGVGGSYKVATPAINIQYEATAFPSATVRAIDSETTNVVINAKLYRYPREQGVIYNTFMKR